MLTDNNSEKKVFLSVRNAHVTYRGYEREILHGVSFDVIQGEILCIVGESGSGKSSVLRAVMGLDEDCILTEGSLIINTDDSASQDLSLMKYSERKKLCGRIIGHIAQDPEQAFMPVRSIEKQWIETLRDNDLYRRDEFKSTATEVLIKAGFTDIFEAVLNKRYKFGINLWKESLKRPIYRGLTALTSLSRIMPQQTNNTRTWSLGDGVRGSFSQIILHFPFIIRA